MAIASRLFTRSRLVSSQDRDKGQDTCVLLLPIFSAFRKPSMTPVWWSSSVQTRMCLLSILNEESRPCIPCRILHGQKEQRHHISTAKMIGISNLGCSGRALDLKAIRSKDGCLVIGRQAPIQPTVLSKSRLRRGSCTNCLSWRLYHSLHSLVNLERMSGNHRIRITTTK